MSVFPRKLAFVRLAKATAIEIVDKSCTEKA